MDAQRLPWYHLGQPEHWAHVDRVFYPPGFKFRLHTHDYAELFVVDRGPGVHRIGDAVVATEVGELVFIHPETLHALGARPERALSFTNISIPLALFRDLERRLGSAASWPWRSEPIASRLDALHLHRLVERIAELEASDGCRDRIQVEAFLLEAMWMAACTRRRRPAVPPVLAQALRELADPENLRSGVIGMARRAGWSREHLNRQMRKHLGETAVGVLTRHRLDHAARMLRHSDLEVLDICQRCGLDNLSHFYRLFRRRFGCPPGAWRHRLGPGAA